MNQPATANYQCMECGKSTDICYSDSGVLGMVHGDIRCRDCYVAAGHPECPSCKELTYPNWRFCAHCGERAEAERDRLREQLRLATEALVTGKAFRDTLVKCSTVGWPSEVIKAFYTWQPELFAALVAIKQGGNKTDVLTLPHHGTLIESAEQSDTFSVVTEETVTGGG